MQNGGVTIEYINYSEDGENILNGTEDSSYPSFILDTVTWNADVAVRGCNLGKLDAAATFTAFPPFELQGTGQSELNGVFFDLPVSP